MSTPVEIGPFTKGVNLVDPLTKLAPEELSICKNWRTGERGDFYKRPGHDYYGTSPAKVNGDNAITLLLRYYKADGTKKTIAACNGKLKSGNDSTGAWTQIDIDGVSGNNMETTKLADWFVYKNRLYIVDGTRPQRYNGTDDIYAGHVEPAAPTLGQGTGGSLQLVGVYKYFVTSVAGDMGEGSAGSVATITLTGSNNKVDLSAIPVAAAKHEETTKKIYRTKAGGSVYYFVAEIATATTTYTDTMADTALGAEYIPVHDPYSDNRFAIVGHDERIYWFGRAGVNASIVDVSDVGYPDRIKDTEFFTVANNDGDILTGGGLVPGGVVFFKKNSMWLLRAFGFGLINIKPKDKRGSSGVGTTAPFSVVSTPAGLIFLSQRGEIYLFDGTNVTEIGRKVSKEFNGMTETAMGKVVACYHDYRYQISYDYRGQKGYNWKTLEFDILNGKWEGPHENDPYFTPSYYSVWDSVLDKGELYFGESRPTNGSYIYGRTEFTKTDRGKKFPAIARSGAQPRAALGDIKATKVFVHGDISSDAVLEATFIDDVGNRISTDLNTPVVANAAVYGKSKYKDGSKYGGRTSVVMEGSLGPKARAKVPSYEVTDNASAVVARMNHIFVLEEALPLK